MKKLLMFYLILFYTSFCYSHSIDSISFKTTKQITLGKIINKNITYNVYIINFELFNHSMGDKCLVTDNNFFLNFINSTSYEIYSRLERGINSIHYIKPKASYKFSKFVIIPDTILIENNHTVCFEFIWVSCYDYKIIMNDQKIECIKNEYLKKNKYKTNNDKKEAELNIKYIINDQFKLRYVLNEMHHNNENILISYLKI